MIRRHSTRGFTLIELLVASALSVVFAAMVVKSISTLNQTAADTARSALAQTQTREGMDSAVRALRGARSLGACQDEDEYRENAAGDLVPVPPTWSVDVEDCLKVIDLDFRLEKAEPNEVMFYAYNEAYDQATTSEPTGAAPDRIRIFAVGCELRMTRTSADPDITYTSKWKPSTAEDATKTFVLGQLASSSPSRIFEYFDASGAPVEGAGEALGETWLQGVPSADEQVVAVEFSPLFSAGRDCAPSDAAAVNSYRTTVFVEFSSSSYTSTGGTP